MKQEKNISSESIDDCEFIRVLRAAAKDTKTQMEKIEAMRGAMIARSKTWDWKYNEDWKTR